MSVAPSGLVGHAEAWRAWHAALASPRLHHGWLLAGRRGVGKAAFARAAARELVGSSGHAGSGEHPDILLLTHLPKDDAEARKRDEGKPFETRRNIGIDQIRTLQHRLITRPTLGARRAVIIDPADDLEPGAANALLKSLEEPPAGTLFLLVAHRLGRLLPTIRSRCRVLRFPDLSAEAIAAILAREQPQADPAMREAAIAAAAGSPGAALDFVAFDLADMHALMRRIAGEGDPAFALRGKLAEAMGPRAARARQIAAIELARAVLRSRKAGLTRAQIPALVAVDGALARLAAEAPTFNYDPGLLAMRLGGLLTQLAVPRGAPDG